MLKKANYILLFKILKHNNVSAKSIKVIQESIEFQKEIFKNTIEQSIIEDEISILSKEEFDLISKNSNEVKVKFKIVEVLQNFTISGIFM